MSSVCKSAIGCVDARVLVRANYVNLYKWPESDAEFVKSISRGRITTQGEEDNCVTDRANPRSTPIVVDSYSCRQMYLRSYTFSKKETVPEKTIRCLGRVKGKAADFRFIRWRNKKKDNNNKCAILRKFREASCFAINSIVHRLLSCTAVVEVADKSLGFGG
ncbi:uncharacterized protein [Typha latifolia]|uniref:uncharacterized protein n=1 Tax=Typha latifolia TaxID=4733 RepID=UPI003C2BA2B1